MNSSLEEPRGSDCEDNISIPRSCSQWRFTPQDIAATTGKVLAQRTNYLPVATDGAARAAGLLAELL